MSWNSLANTIYQFYSLAPRAPHPLPFYQYSGSTIVMDSQFDPAKIVGGVCLLLYVERERSRQHFLFTFPPSTILHQRLSYWNRSLITGLAAQQGGCVIVFFSDAGKKLIFFHKKILELLVTKSILYRIYNATKVSIERQSIKRKLFQQKIGKIA